jgi:hypothetical protein
VLGVNERSAALVQQLLDDPGSDLRPLGLVAHDGSPLEEGPSRSYQGVPVVGTVQDLDLLAHDLEVDVVLVPDARRAGGADPAATRRVRLEDAMEDPEGATEASADADPRSAPGDRAEGAPSAGDDPHRVFRPVDEDEADR